MTEKTKQNFDVIVVGSGASGGWACKRLSEAGLKVALLEAGRPQSDKNFTEHKPAFELKYRNMAAEIIRKTRPSNPSSMSATNTRKTGSSTISRSRTPLRPTSRSTGWAGCA